MAPARMHGIGPLAVETTETYQQLQGLLDAISNTQHAYKKISQAKAQDGTQTSASINETQEDIQGRHAGLALQRQMLSMIGERLSNAAHQPPQLTDL